MRSPRQPACQVSERSAANLSTTGNPGRLRRHCTRAVRLLARRLEAVRP
jgi:hypothetical protein